MTEIKLHVVGASASAIVVGTLTEHSVGIPVHITFDSAWDGLTKTGYARCGNTDRVIVLDGNGDGSIPWECLIEGNRLLIGVDGIAEDGSIRIPTVWAMAGTVRSSVADSNASEAEPQPTPSAVEQITAIVQSADSKAQSIVDRANAGEFKGDPGEKGDKGDPGQISEDAISEAVQDYLEEHPVEAPVQSVNGQVGNVHIDIPSNVSQLQNDAGYLTQHQDISGKQDKITDLDAIRAGAAAGATALQSESDPTVPAWAKQPSKPSYTAEEVGALPADTPLFDGNYESLSNKPTIPEAYDDTAIRQLIGQKYSKPSGGIPASDLASGVIPEPVTDEHINGLIEIKMPTIPDKLPNPNALTFSGAATGSYDGSQPLSIEIPQGGGGGGGAWTWSEQYELSEDVTSFRQAIPESAEEIILGVSISVTTKFYLNYYIAAPDGISSSWRSYRKLGLLQPTQLNLFDYLYVRIIKGKYASYNNNIGKMFVQSNGGIITTNRGAVWTGDTEFHGLEIAAGGSDVIPAGTKFSFAWR